VAKYGIHMIVMWTYNVVKRTFNWITQQRRRIYNVGKLLYISKSLHEPTCEIDNWILCGV
jgi:hypothetical protein